MKAIDLFYTVDTIGEIDKETLLSIIYSNPVEDDFISTMLALIDFVEENYASLSD